MDNTIYVVEGTTGEYSDRNMWLVCAYKKENQAKEHVEKANALARELFLVRQDMSWDKFEICCKELMGEFDPYISMDYTGTQYYYYPVVVRTTVPK